MTDQTLSAMREKLFLGFFVAGRWRLRAGDRA
jgi:hypothetical protein